MNPLVLLKKIITIFLICSLVLYSPISRANPALGAAAVGILTYNFLITPLAKKVLKKIGDILGYDNHTVNDDGSVKYYSYGNLCFSDDLNDRGTFNYALNQIKEGFLKNYDEFHYSVHLARVVKHSGGEGHIFNIFHGYDEDDAAAFRSVITCDVMKQSTITNDEIRDLIEDLANRGDEDAKQLLGKKDDSDDSDSDSSLGSGTGKKDGDDGDDGTGTKKGDGTDDGSGGGDDDDDDGSGASDDLTCDSTKFHKKVCDFIDWTYDTYDTTHDKIKEYFEDEDFEKDSLKDLVKEEEVIMRNSDFDLPDACPVPKYVHTSFLGNPISIQVFNFEGVCKWASFIEYALQTTSLIIAFNIIAGRREI